MSRAELTSRVARLAELLTSSDAAVFRIESGDDEIELRRQPRAQAPQAPPPAEPHGFESEPLRLDTIKADLVGIFHLGRPAPLEGEVLDGERDLGFVEALGIRNPVRSMGGGRIVAIAASDGTAVEYGQPLFLVDRG
jgi:acetyl-CoA carboxylase biotin carboxyl carrier protein